jgi:hypothetical protein
VSAINCRIWVPYFRLDVSVPIPAAKGQEGHAGLNEIVAGTKLRGVAAVVGIVRESSRCWVEVEGTQLHKVPVEVYQLQGNLDRG